MFFSDKKTLIVISLFSFLLFSISSCKEVNIEYPVEMMSKDVINNVIKTRIDTIYLGHDFISAQKFYVYHDSILIVGNRQTTTTCFVEVYNLSTQKMIAQLYPKGNGHGEVLSCIMALSGNTLIIDDFMKSQYAFVDLDSLLQNPFYSVLPQRHPQAQVSMITPFGEKYLVENQYCFSCSKEQIFEGKESIEQGIENGVPRFIVLDSLSEETDISDVSDDDAKYKYWTRNVAVDGHFVVNPIDSRVLYASFRKAEIEVYDAELSVKKVLKGPFEFVGNYAIKHISNDDLPLVMCHQSVPYAYLGYAYNQGDDVCFLYIGDFLKLGASEDSFKSYIVVVDWDGNLKKFMHVDKYLTSISKSYADENVYYGMVHNNDGLPRLVKITADED